jgi:hypothetical protein
MCAFWFAKNQNLGVKVTMTFKVHRPLKTRSLMTSLPTLLGQDLGARELPTSAVGAREPLPLFSLYDLPDEMLLAIATVTPNTWANACDSIPMIGNWCLWPPELAMTKKLFTNKYPRGDRTLYTLNSRLIKVEYTNGMVKVVNPELTNFIEWAPAPLRQLASPLKTIESYYVVGDNNNNKVLPPESAHPKEFGNDIVWYRFSVVHRDYGPAVESADGTRKWIKDGLLHRVDGPAIEWGFNGRREWYHKNKLHRLDGPALEWPGVLSKWFMHGELHRQDGPAVELVNNGEQQWYLNGKKHRVDGPAVITGTRREWYFNDLRHRSDGPAVESDSTEIGTAWNPTIVQEWWLNGVKHRSGDLPAVVHVNGTLEWWQWGKRHRPHGPAIMSYYNNSISNTPTTHWYQNGLLHRSIGPAIKYSDGSELWYYHGVPF